MSGFPIYDIISVENYYAFLDIVDLKYCTNFALIGESCIVNAYSGCNLCNVPVVLLALTHLIQYET